MSLDLSALDAANAQLQAAIDALHVANQPAPPPVAIPLAWPTAGATVAADSQAKIQAFSGYALHAGGGPFAMADVAWRDAPVGTPIVAVAQRSGNGTVASVSLPLPAGTKHSGTSDAGLFIVDAADGTEYDLEGCNAAITSAAGVAYARPGELNATRPGGGVNANAARLTSSLGLVTPTELASGRIRHALYFVMPNVGPGPNPYPAGSQVGYINNSGLPLGSWLDLDPAVDLGALNLPAWQRILGVALQQFGMFLRDIGSSFHICLTDQANQKGNAVDWPAVGVPLAGSNLAGQPYIASFSANFPWSRLRLLEPPAHV